MFTSRYRLKAGNQERSTDFTVPEKKVIPWPVSQLNKSADPIINVQIAIKDQVYAEELRRVLVEDKKHRVYFVDTPNPTIDGIVVLDEITIGHLAAAKGTDTALYIVLRKESSDPDKLGETGVRCLLPAEYPPHMVRLAILAAELSLSQERSSVGSVPNADSK